MGDEAAPDEISAHLGLIVSPGNLADAWNTCASCHPMHVKAVLDSNMHTGTNIVRVTRHVLEPDTSDQTSASFQTLGHGIADSLLRKQCASCHLGQIRKPHEPDAVKDRGGGCLACHLNTIHGDQHPTLTARVEDGRCFGCHSRSGRISLSYAGLAEVDSETSITSAHDYAKLSDGRLLRRQLPDVHHKAGMACIDCHTGTGLMGLETKDGHHAVDISCDDCHDNKNPALTIANWPEKHRSMLERIPFKTENNQTFLQTPSGTPLWHIEISAGNHILYPKLGGKPVNIPQAGDSHIPLSKEHQSLTCVSCHATWIPTCLGCHMSYDENNVQWDHASQQFTQGAWHEHRWHTGTGPATLGRLDNSTVDVFLPGMIMSMDHPALDETRFIRRFAKISPHTTGTSRRCVDCHRSSTALGLGKGRLQVTQGKLEFQAEMAPLNDGLPADAWTSLEKSNDQNNQPYPRPFNAQEINQLYRSLPDETK